jgi:hypothetical protein
MYDLNAWQIKNAKHNLPQQWHMYLTISSISILYFKVCLSSNGFKF